MAELVGHGFELVVVVAGGCVDDSLPWGRWWGVEGVLDVEENEENDAGGEDVDG